MSNPLLETGYIVPDFAAIKPEHFEPAFEAIAKDIRAKADALKDSEEAPSFANTVAPLERLFDDLGRVFGIYSTFYLNRISQPLAELAPVLMGRSNELQKEIFQDPSLASRFKAVYDTRNTHVLNPQQKRVLENLYLEFEDNGTFLSEEDKKALNKIDEELIIACDKFENNTRTGATARSFLVTDPGELAGVPEDSRSSMKRDAATALAGTRPGADDESKEFASQLPPEIIAELKQMEQGGLLDSAYLFKPERLTVDNLLPVAENREFREKMFRSVDAIATEAPFDNEPVLAEIQRLRQERVAVLNKARPADKQFATYTDRALSQTMSKDLATVESLFADLERPLLDQLEQEMEDLQKFAASKGEHNTLEPWDTLYWAARYKKEVLGYDAAEMSAYLNGEDVVQGFINHCQKLFGLDFIANEDYPKIHEDVRPYDVYGKDGKYVGIIVMDIFQRPGKRGGAWADDMQKRTEGRPVISFLNLNLAKPDKNSPSLMSDDWVRTFYHEGGHCLNQILGTDSPYVSLHGTNHSADFVEIHSMTQERWPFEREVLDTYAKHHKTGQPVPEKMLEAKAKADAFLRCLDPLKIIQNARRDFLFHNMNPADYKGTKDIHQKARMDSAYADHVRPYALTRFDHLFSSPNSSYAAGYYGYLAADRSAEDAFAPFRKAGLYNAELADRLEKFYAAGATEATGTSYRNLMGRDPSNAALLEALGVSQEKKPQARPNGQSGGPTVS